MRRLTRSAYVRSEPQSQPLITTLSTFGTKIIGTDGTIQSRGPESDPGVGAVEAVGARVGNVGTLESLVWNCFDIFPPGKNSN